MTADLRTEIAAAFPLAPFPEAPLVQGTDDEGIALSLLGKAWSEVTPSALRRDPRALMRLASPAFRYYLAAWLMASIEDPEDPDIIPAMVVAAIAARGGDARMLTPKQRKVVARYVAMHADDADLRGGKLLAALGNLTQ